MIRNLTKLKTEISLKSREIDYENDMKLYPERNLTVTMDYTSKRCDKISKEIIKEIRKVTPLFNLNFSWKNITADSVIMPLLKRKPDYYNKFDCVYKFTCETGCEKVYIGETKRRLRERFMEHGRLKSSSICTHIAQCEHYKLKLNDAYDNPGVKDKREFLKSHFKIMCSGLSDYRQRTVREALMIRLYRPSLNEQTIHRSIQII